MVTQTYKFPTKTLANFAASEMKKAGLFIISESNLYVEVRGLLSDRAVSIFIKENRGMLVNTTTEDSSDLNEVLDLPLTESKMFPRFKKGKKLNEQGHQVTETLNKALDKIEGYMMDGLSKREAYRMWSKTSGLAQEFKQQVGHRIGLDEVAPPAKKEAKPAEKSGKGGVEGAAMKVLKSKVESDPKKFPKLAAALGVGKKDAKKESVQESKQILTEAGIKDMVLKALSTPEISQKFKRVVALKNNPKFTDEAKKLSTLIVYQLSKLSYLSMGLAVFLDKMKADKIVLELIKKVASSDAGVSATNHLTQAVSSLVMGYNPAEETIIESAKWEKASFSGLNAGSGVSMGWKTKVGNFYYFMVKTGDKFLVYAGDPSGKGVPANAQNPISSFKSVEDASKGIGRIAAASKKRIEENSSLDEAKFFRMQDWARMSREHKSPTPVRIITKDRKVIDGRLKKFSYYDSGIAYKGYHIILHPPKQGMKEIVVDDVDVMNIYFGDAAIRQRVLDKTVKTQKSKLPEPPKAESVEVDEVAPPSGVGRKIAKKQSSKLAFSKTYGPEKGKQIRYATAWKAYNKGK